MKNEVREFDKRIQYQVPRLPWRTPIRVSMIDGSKRGWACRLCIARIGLKAEELGSRAFTTRAEFDQHLKDVHGL
jgi:hypothetical protein